MEKRLEGQILFLFIRLIGLFSICLGIKELFVIDNEKMLLNLIALSLFYLFFSPLAVTLPSGAHWRPGMAFILFSLLYFDYKLVILVAIPGTLFNARGRKGYFNRFFLTIGHLAIGIFASGISLDIMNVEFSASLITYFAITVCLFVHFCFNRLIAAFIVAQRRQRSFLGIINIVRKADKLMYMNKFEKSMVRKSNGDGKILVNVKQDELGTCSQPQLGIVTK